MGLNGINYTEKHLTDEEMAVVEAMRMGAEMIIGDRLEKFITAEESVVIDKMREEGANPYECIEALEERVEVLEGIIKDIAYAHDNIKCLQTDISSYIRKM